MATILVVGGAGYIGSHMVLMLLECGHEVVVFDNLEGGHREAVLGGELVVGDLSDRAALAALFERQFDAILHFAAFALVGESVSKPAKYYQNNVANTLNLLDANVARGPVPLIFSSTCAIFGEPEYLPVDEQHPQRPINPYGRSKRMVEQVLADYEQAYGLRSIALRYFNAAGADPLGRIGEWHRQESRLLTLTLQAAGGWKPAITVFGRDYDTPDGTCIRDYVHVVDLCSAHLAALERLLAGAASTAYNLGNGEGFSVQQVIETAERVTGRRVPVVDGPRRPGDPARLIGDSRRAREELGWRPQYPDLATILHHAWQWEQRRPH